MMLQQRSSVARVAPIGPPAALRRSSIVAPRLRGQRCSAAADVQPVAKVDPFAEKTVYNDKFFDKLFIKIYAQKMANQLEGVTVPEQADYADFVRVSKEIMRGRTPEQQKQVVDVVLASLLPPGAPATFRKLFPPTQLSAELNAWFATLGFGWLVGAMELHTGDVEVEPGVMRKQKSIVKIKKCRYLEASGCVGMCVNMCKVPTESFFTQSFGLPLTMKPNFETLGCDMVFGEMPKSRDVDEAFKQPCFTQCNVGKLQAAKPCIKV